MKHTPGPWTCIEVAFDDYQTGNISFVVDSAQGPAVMVGSVANCRLIAAAPDMYEALKVARDALAEGLETEVENEAEHSILATKFLVHVDAILAKAEGKV